MGGGEGRRGELDGETPEWEGVTAVILAGVRARRRSDEAVGGGGGGC